MKRKKKLFEYFKKRYENTKVNLGLQLNDGKKSVAQILASRVFSAGVFGQTHQMVYSEYCKNLSDYFIIELKNCLALIKPKTLNDGDRKKFYDYNSSMFDGILRSATQYYDEWIAAQKDLPIGAGMQFKTEIISLINKFKNDSKTKIEIVISDYNFNPQNTFRRLKDNIILLVLSSVLGLFFGIIGGYMGTKLDKIIKLIIDLFR